MAKNEALGKAKDAKQDEFYTQLSDIENELRHYRPHFRGKTVLCNCDDPYESNFFKYFALNFNKLKLKKLVATCYAGSPITGTQLTLFGDETDDERRTPYKAVVTSVHDTTGEGGIGGTRGGGEAQARPGARGLQDRRAGLPARVRRRGQIGRGNGLQRVPAAEGAGSR